MKKVNPSHPDKIADRIAGAIVDIAYALEDNPKIAVEVLIGHGECNIIAESSVPIKYSSDNKFYYEFDGIRLIYEDNQFTGWYNPNLNKVI